MFAFFMSSLKRTPQNLKFKLHKNLVLHLGLNPIDINQLILQNQNLSKMTPILPCHGWFVYIFSWCARGGCTLTEHHTPDFMEPEKVLSKSIKTLRRNLIRF